MTVLNVPDIHCKNCIARITRALNDAGMVFNVSLQARTVTIYGDNDEVNVPKAKEILEDLGFEAQ